MRVFGLALALALIVAAPALAQRGTGEIRLIVRDATGAAVSARGTITSDTTHIDRSFATDENGACIAPNLPFGLYRLTVAAAGFTTFSATVDIRSEIPLRYPVTLTVAPVTTTVVVSPAEPPLLDPYRAGSASFVGGDLLRSRPAAPPGHSIVDLVDTLPGWFETSNGVLHPRAAEYQVQYVVDGIPLRDNRSPAFAQSLGVDELESLTARTAGFPAEFGGKLGGVIEITTARDRRDGFHGVGDLRAGSFGALNGFFSGQYGRRGTTAGASVEAMRTNRYLDPPIEQNFTNHATGLGVAGRVEHDWSDNDRTRAYAHHRDTNFLVPNDALQEIAGQRQERASAETLAQAAHQHIFSSDVLMSAAVMARHTGATLDSNAASTPIRPTQDRSFDDLYANTSVTAHRGVHELKAGGELTFATIDERFSSTITADRVNGVRVFDRDLPSTFSFAGRRPLREQALWVQDQLRVGPATISAGLRYDHYSLIVDDAAVSPRLSAAWFVAPARLVVHGSYDRSFETPPVENVILASSDLVASLGGQGRSLSLRPSRGNFYEAGVAKELFGRARLDVNAYVRSIDNFFDDDLLLNTAVSFPFTFSHALIKGVDTSLDVPRWGRASASLRYSYSVGTGTLPISGGLFLGADVDELLSSTARFPVSEDQRHTVRARVRCQLTPRVSIGAAARIDSGLPIELEGAADTATLAAQYGRDVLDRVDLDAGRVRPSSSIDLSAAIGLWKRDGRSTQLQLDVFNVSNRLNVITFASLLSGTSLGSGRSAALRLRTEF